MKKIIGIFSLLMILVFVLAACGEAEIEKVNNDQISVNQESNNDAPEENLEEDTEGEKEPEEKADNETQELVVGNTVDFDGLKITLNEARIETGGEFDTPENAQFVVVNLTAENTTEEEQVVSSIMNIELKDSESYVYTTTILMEGTKGQFDGSIEPGGTLRGEVPFDVPESESYELHFSDPFKSGKAIWKIPSDQLTQ